MQQESENIFVWSRAERHKGFYVSHMRYVLDCKGDKNALRATQRYRETYRESQVCHQSDPRVFVFFFILGKSLILRGLF